MIERGSFGRWLLRAAGRLLLAFAACFLLLHALPGDPLDRLDSPSIPAEQADRTRRALGLDRPLLVQFSRSLAGYLTGDLGVSIGRRRPVAEVLAGALPATLALGAAALLLAYGGGFALAALAAAPRSGRVRRVAASALLALGTAPRFWLGVMLVLVFHAWAGWLPASHAVSPGGGGWADMLRHLVLPALALGVPAACNVGRYLLAATEVTRRQAHVAAARAAGGGGARLTLQHVLRPAAGPALTLFGLDLPVLVSGAIVIEVVFAWPGVGRLTAEAVLGGDYPLALGAATLSAGFIVLGRMASNTLADRMFPERRAGAAGAA